MAYSPEEKQAAVELLDAANRMPRKRGAAKIAESARSYAMAIITDAPYPEVARRDTIFLGAFCG